MAMLEFFYFSEKSPLGLVGAVEDQVFEYALVVRRGSSGQKAQHKSQGRRKVTSDPFVRRAFDRSKGRAVATVLTDLRRRVEVVARERA